jgi:hypothetical protein
MGNSAQVTKEPVEKSGSAASTVKEGTTPKEEFDIEKANVDELNEEAQKIIKGFQADYTQKTTALAEDRKELEDRAKSGEEWSNWYKENEPLVEEFNEWKKNKDLDDGSDDDETIPTSEDAKVRSRIDGLETMYKTGFGMLLGLMKVQRENPDYNIDAEKVITYAQKENITNMDKAFKGAYSDDILKKTVAEGVEKAKKDWEEKHKTDVMSTNMPIGRETRKVIKAKKR